MVWAKLNGIVNNPDAGVLKTLCTRVKRRGYSLVVDITIKPPALGDKAEYLRTEYWIKDSCKISAAGYVRAEGLKDSIVWWGVPVYCRILGGVIPESVDGQTATTLNNSMKSRATKKFIKTLTRGSLPSMDIQKIAMIGILAVGAILGMTWLGVF